MRMLSLLLSLVLALGLIQANAVTASATQGDIYSFTHAYDCQRTPPFPKKGESFKAYSFKTPLNASSSHFGGDVNAEYVWKLTSLGNYGSVASPSSNLTSIVGSVATTYGVDKNNVEVFQLTKDGVYVAKGVIFAQSSEVTAFLGDNWNSDGSTYLLSSSTLTDPTTVTISRDVTTGFEPPAPVTPQHTHNWTPATSGNGTKEAATTITCSGCGETLTVTLTASNVTLPGNVFSARITTERISAPAVAVYALNAAAAQTPQGLPEGLKISETPGYKYSPDGSNFTEIDPKTFTPVPGFYQASILVNCDGWNQPENLYVNYTVSDPAVTAATGDNRPIELMVMGMAFFSVLAIAAFALDSKRRVRR